MAERTLPNPSSSNTNIPRFRNSLLSLSGTPELNESIIALSPVTNLTLNLDGLTTNSAMTPKRRISWSSDTPVRPLFLPPTDTKYCSSPASYLDSPSTFQPRQLRDITSEADSYPNRVPNPNLYNDSDSCSQHLALPRAALRRIRSLPARAFINKQKENIPEANSSIVEEELKGLPIKTSHRLSVLGISDWVDSDSQDSGCCSQDDRSSISSTSSMISSFIEPKVPKKSKEFGCLDTPDLCCLSRRSSSVRSSVMADNEDEEFDDGFEVFNEQEHNIDEKDSRLRGLFIQPIVLPHKSKNDSTSEEVDFHSPNSPQALSRVPVRRSLSMFAGVECSQISVQEDQENQKSPPMLLLNRKRLLNTDDVKMAFKKPDPPGDSSFLIEIKRRKSVSAMLTLRRPSDSQIRNTAFDEKLESSQKRSLVHRSYSHSDVRIDSALQRADQEKNLIGDYSGRNLLPVMDGRHPDLKSISVDTLSSLINGDFNDILKKYTIVDCRYPYEYEGGHIQGSCNLFTKDSIIQHFLNEIPKNIDQTQKDKTPGEDGAQNKHCALIFHCEFSSERGPKLYRFLRTRDRQVNKDNYPFLFYPEIYILEGGYKEFYSKHKELCEPQLYKPMSHKDHKQDLSHFRTKSKSWNGDTKVRVAFRTGLKL